jgi:hypothetical protein
MREQILAEQAQRGAEYEKMAKDSQERERQRE